VSGVEVLAPRQVGGIVAFGDSLIEGNISQFDANHRWPDQLHGGSWCGRAVASWVW